MSRNFRIPRKYWKYGNPVPRFHELHPSLKPLLRFLRRPAAAPPHTQHGKDSVTKEGEETLARHLRESPRVDVRNNCRLESWNLERPLSGKSGLAPGPSVCCVRVLLHLDSLDARFWVAFQARLLVRPGKASLGKAGLGQRVRCSHRQPREALLGSEERAVFVAAMVTTRPLVVCMVGVMCASVAPPAEGFTPPGCFGEWRSLCSRSAPGPTDARASGAQSAP